MKPAQKQKLNHSSKIQKATRKRKDRENPTFKKQTAINQAHGSGHG